MLPFWLDRSNCYELLRIDGTVPRGTWPVERSPLFVLATQNLEASHAILLPLSADKHFTHTPHVSRG